MGDVVVAETACEDNVVVSVAACDVDVDCVSVESDRLRFLATVVRVG